MAGEGDVERLVVMLEARIRDFEKNMAKASGTATQNYDRMRGNSRKATQQMETDMARSTGRINQALALTSSKIGTLGKTALTGLTGGLLAGGVAGFVSKIGDIANAIVETGNEAKRAGISFQSFQELSYVAERNKISVDALTDGIKELQLRADEYIVTGAGSAKESFERLGFSAEELNRKLQDPSALFTEIIGKLEKLDKAAQIRISDELFGGTGGEQFVQLIEMGEQGIRDTIDRAHELGRVLEDDTLQKARDLDQAFADVANTVSTGLQQSIINATWSLFDFLQSFDQIEKRTTASLENRMREVDKQRVLLEAQILQAQADVRNFTGADAQLAQIKHNLEMMKAEMADLTDESVSIALVLDARTPITPPSTSKTPTVPGSGKSTRSTATDEAEKQKKAIDQLIASLEFEKAIMGLSAEEQERLNLLRSVSVDETSEQGQIISQLVRERQAEEEQLERLNELYDQGQQMTRSFFSDLKTNLQAGKSWWESFAIAASNAIDTIANKALEAAADGVWDMIFGAFKSALGGGMNWTPATTSANTGLPLVFAGGGSVSGPGTSTSDSIPAMLSDGEFVVNARAAQKNRGFLEWLNGGGRLQGFAQGGMVAASNMSRASGQSMGGGGISISIGSINANSEAEGAAAARGLVKELRKILPDEMERYNRNPLRRAS